MVASRQRDNKIIENYEAGVPTYEIAEKFNVSKRRVQQIVTRAGASRPKESLSVPNHRGRPISKVHERVGRELWEAAASQRLLDDTAELSEAVQLSVKKCSMVRRGLTELTLTELTKIAKFCGMSVSELLMTREEKKAWIKAKSSHTTESTGSTTTPS